VTIIAQNHNIVSLQLVTLETTLRLYWRDPRLRVDHILGNKSNDNSYVLLHPDAGKYIWFPDIYIGKSEKNKSKLFHYKQTKQNHK
jgi:hypothetical protein